MNGSIKGRVIAVPGARPAAGVPVRLAYRGGGARGIDGLPATAMRRVTTRGDGWFAVDALQPGVWRVAAGDSAPLDVDVLAWAATDLTLEVRHAAIAAPRPEPMPAEPMNAPRGAPQPDIWRERDDAPPDRPRPDIWPDPDAPARGVGDASGDDRPVWQGGDDGSAPSSNACRADHSVHMNSVGDTGRVRGLVLWAGSFEPVEDATVMVVNGHGASPDLAPITDADGRFAIDGLDAGLWIFRAIAEDGATGENVVAVRATSTSEIVIEVGGTIGTSGWGDLRRVD